MQAKKIGLMLGIALALVTALVVAVPAGGQQDPTASPTPTSTATPTPTPTPKPRVVSRKVVRPPRVVHKRKHFVPWSQPTITQVYFIIDHESRGNSAVEATLDRRIACESGYRWYATNGQYEGLGQFANETFYRGFNSMPHHGVAFKVRRERWRHTRIVKTWSDGHVTRSRGHRVRQVVLVHKKGKIPSWVPRTHGWAQVRIMARAIRGQGNVNDSEWQCR